MVTTRNDDQGTDWDAVIGRSLAYLCLHHSGMKSEKLLEQADFLARVGVNRKDTAAILGTSDDSLRVLGSQRAKWKTAAKRKTRAK